MSRSFSQEGFQQPELQNELSLQTSSLLQGRTTFN